MPNFDNELQEYQNILFYTQEGNECRQYMQDRNILPKTAKYWNLGYCPINYTPTCYNDLSQQKVNHFWKKLQGRLIIPIFDQNGKLISLSGRAIFKGMWPKYDHYPFPAKRTLFGLYQNKNNIRTENKSIITEGQLDVISAWQNDIRIVTSSFGAHAGIEHLALLGRYTNNIYIIYDSDDAGNRGTYSIKKLNKADLNIQFCNNLFPQGEDMDNWVQNHTKNELYTLIETNTENTLKQQISKLLNKKIVITD